MHQNWMRDYDPTTGRYLEADPLGLIDAASVYGYVKGNPGRWVDPTGEFIPVIVACLVNPICRTATGTAAGLLYGYLVDEDGCYTWAEMGYYGAMGATAYWGAGRPGRYLFRPDGLFRRGGWWSTGRNWRMGWNRKGGDKVFRWYDRWSNSHWDWFDGGPL